MTYGSLDKIVCNFLKKCVAMIFWIEENNWF